MTFNILTIFPSIFDSYFNEGMLKRGQKNGIFNINIHNLRDWTNDKHKTVDDAPYGGGAGMVMKVEPIYKALNTLVLGVKKNKNNIDSRFLIPDSKIILLSAKGKRWNQQLAKKYAKLENITLICGRYEGVDERIKKFIDEEVSIGDYVLTGGELGAMVIVDSVARLLPGVLGNKESAKDESHSEKGVLEYPQYTRPEEFIVEEKKMKVPKVLLSGNHAEIEKWRKAHKKIIKH